MMESALSRIREIIIKNIPFETGVSRIEFEGPEIVIYVSKPELLIGEDILRKIAKEIKKRIIIRSEYEYRKNKQETIEYISTKIQEKNVKIKDAIFDDTFGEVYIMIGGGDFLKLENDHELLRQITMTTLWKPKIVKEPLMKSFINDYIMKIKLQDGEYRRRILRNIGSRIHRPLIFQSGEIRIICLGGFREVGRSAILLETSESRVLLDCGVKPGFTHPLQSFPRIDVPEFSIENLDAVIISHAHLDHCGFLPYLFKYGYEGPVYCTSPTLDLMILLLVDYLQVAGKEGIKPPYSMQDIQELVLHTIPIEYNEVTDIAPDTRLTFYNAGHVLGSAIVHLHIGDGEYNVVYTGDFKFGRTKLLEPASYIFPRVEALIIEGTYGAPTDILPQRIEAEAKIIEIIIKTINKGGKVLIPVLSVGRAQEILLLLNEAFKLNYIKPVPVYVEGMIQEATSIHMIYPSGLSKRIRDLIILENKSPFLSEYFHVLPPSVDRESIAHGEPCIIVATSGMLTGGPALSYFKLLAPDERNTIIFVSYQIPGTLGRLVLSGVKEIPIVSDYGRSEIIRVNMSVYSIEGFSGHSDRRQLLGFMKRITPKPERVFVCHGEESKVIDLANTFSRIFKVNAYAPSNLETIRLK
ncbi:MAG: beta-CASP ribonuclease aCPSF1 [Candidatus Methanomethylicia archaeon]|nr:beta-CASP ribonuclease aCPSF1 [Candidatus Methanomethylicia archaeon]MCX8169341.1 beta-CASP ribonuclease aCPSF1 [Candidatus Methanomethylicia archaeon]